MTKRSFFQKQSLYLLDNHLVAWIVASFFACFLITSWLSLTIMSLLTLRLKWLIGFKCLISIVTTTICCFQIFGINFDALPTLLLTYVTCYIFAIILRLFNNWQIVAITAIIIAIAIVIFIACLMPNVIIQEYQYLLKVLNDINQTGLIVGITEHHGVKLQLILAHYLFGIKLLSALVSAVVPLLLARSLQSALFYVGGFKKEIILFRAHILLLMLLVLIVLGVYRNNLIAVSCLPTVFCYFMISGMSLMGYILADRKKILVFMVLIVPIVIIPYIMLPLYGLFGSIDSIFNLRSRWRLATGH